MKNKQFLVAVLLASMALASTCEAEAASVGFFGQNNTSAAIDTSYLIGIQFASAGHSTASFTMNAATDFDSFISATETSGTVSAKPSIKVRITAYASTPEETDSTPYLTAMGTEVRDGIVAANFLPFGTRIKIPALFGSRIFIVEDRMNQRYRHSVDIWMPNVSHALYFGVQYAAIEVVGSAKQDAQELALSL